MIYKFINLRPIGLSEKNKQVKVFDNMSLQRVKVVCSESNTI